MVKKYFGFFVLLVVASHSAWAFLSQGYNIEQLSQKADMIFIGEVLEVHESPANSTDYPYVEVYFKVFESLKGEVPAVYSFRQFAPKVGKQFKLLGMGKNVYNPGEKLVMFLGSAGSKGLSAPIDLQLFQIQTKSNMQKDMDEAIVLNKQLGEKPAGRLFQNLQNKKTLEVMEKISKKSKLQRPGVQFQDFRELTQASLQ